MSKRTEKGLQETQSSETSEEASKAKTSKDEKPAALPWKNTTGALYANYFLTPAVLIILSIVYMYYTASQVDKSTLKTPEKSKPKGLLMTAVELAKHDGTTPGVNLYIAILGKVYDVEKGRRFYGPGTGYHVFAGRDSTPSFITGMFDREKATDDITGLSPEDMLGIKDWMDFYRKDYTYVGRVIGRYYDADGKPTAALKEARQLIKEGRRLKDRQKEEDVKFPGCNSKWSQAEGAEVWCSKDSAGIHRNWVGVPRQLFKPGAKDPKCVCVRTTGPSSDTGEGSDGNLNHPNLKTYPGCGLLDYACKL